MDETITKEVAEDVYGKEKDTSVTSSCSKRLIHCMSTLPGFLCLISGQSSGLYKRPILERDRQCTYKCNIQARQGNHCCRGKAISITFSECVSVVLFIQYAIDMRRVILSSVASLAAPYFPALSHKRDDFQNKSYWTQNVCFDFLYKFCLKHFLF
jgi:hypothetical protein